MATELLPEKIINSLQFNCFDKIYFARFTRNREYEYFSIDDNENPAKILHDEIMFDPDSFYLNDDRVEFNIDEWFVFANDQFATKFYNDVKKLSVIVMIQIQKTNNYF
tara:strand:+ start:1774 stop:2097 length:324 start_codon:yes stop_codon:yes gene_type:complete